MQVQKINNNTPNFQGIKVQTVTTPLKKIDIYSLTSKDSGFIEKVLNITKGHQLPEDKLIIGGKNPKEVLDASLKQAKNIKDNAFIERDTVLLAVDDNKKISGIANIQFDGDQLISKLASWGKHNSDTRKSLLLAALKSTTNHPGEALVTPRNLTNSMKSFFRKLGFKSTKIFGMKDLMVEDTQIKSAINKTSSQINGDIKIYKRKREIDLAKQLKLDE